MTYVFQYPAGWESDVHVALKKLAQAVGTCPEDLRPLDRPGFVRVTVEITHTPAKESSHD